MTLFGDVFYHSCLLLLLCALLVLVALCYVCVPFVACFLLSSLLHFNSFAVLLIREATGYSCYTLTYSICSVVFLVRSSAFLVCAVGGAG